MDWPHVSPDAIVAAAREFLGTPYHQAGRLRGVGIDCVGLLICTFQALGVPVEDRTGYGAMADNYDLMLAGIAECCDPVALDPECWLPGDILVFRGRMMFNHCGFFTGPEGFIHAYASPAVDCVAEHPLDAKWLKRVANVYRYKGAVL